MFTNKPRSLSESLSGTDNWLKVAGFAYANFKRLGRGAVVVDSTSEGMGSGSAPPIYFVTESLGAEDVPQWNEAVRPVIADYDPETEIVLVALTDEGVEVFTATNDITPREAFGITLEARG